MAASDEDAGSDDGHGWRSTDTPKATPKGASATGGFLAYLDEDDTALLVSPGKDATDPHDDDSDAEDKDDPRWQPSRHEDLAYLLPGDRVRTVCKTHVSTGIKGIGDVDSRSLPKGTEATVVRNGALGFMQVCLDTCLMVCNYSVCVVRLNYIALQTIPPTSNAVRRPDAPGEYVVLKPVTVVEELQNPGAYSFVAAEPVAMAPSGIVVDAEPETVSTESELEELQGELLGTFGGRIVHYDALRGIGFIESPGLRELRGSQGYARVWALGSYQVGDRVSFTAYENLRGGNALCLELKDEGPPWQCKVCGRENDEELVRCRVCNTRPRYFSRDAMRALEETLEEHDRVVIVALDESRKRVRGYLQPDHDDTSRWIVLVDKEKGVRHAMPVGNTPPLEFTVPSGMLG